MVQTLKLGMIGGGIDAFIGNVHRIAARLDGHWELVAGALSSTAEKSIKSGQQLGLAEDRIYPSWQAMLEQETTREDKIDAVAIVTPNHMHAEPVIKALQMGFHVICDKPLTVDLQTARKIEEVVKSSNKHFFLTHNYSATPMIRMAKQMIAEGKLGNIRIINVEYAQGWLAKPEDNKQAKWRTDPKQSGAVGCLGDIGTHAFQLAEYVSGLSASRVMARLNRFVEGRLLDDDAQIMIDYSDGAKGILWASQVAIGHENGLCLRIYGDKGSIIWRQEEPNQIEYHQINAPKVILTRGGAGFDPSIDTRIPAGHPEGYLEAFAQIYKDAALIIKGENVKFMPPSIHDGVRGLEFITACLASANNSNSWQKL